MTFQAMPQASLRRLAASAALLFLAVSSAMAADSVVVDPILVERGNVSIRKSDFDAEMLRIPEKDRATFLASPKRVRDLLERMMMTLELADTARAKGVDKDPGVARRIELEQDKILAQTYITNVETAARREFDAKLPSVEPAIRESYLVNKAKYTKPDTVMISQLNFRFDGAPDIAKARADDAYAKIKAGADIGDIVEQVTDNAALGKLRGIRGPLERKDVDPELVALVFETGKVGVVNAPVRTQRTWSIVRVNERIPGSLQSYEEAKPSIINLMRDEYVTHARDAALAELGAGKKLVVNEPAIEALRAPAGAKN
jgi:parvulin-like peptidyl-prolyl isomerase